MREVSFKRATSARLLPTTAPFNNEINQKTFGYNFHSLTTRFRTKKTLKVYCIERNKTKGNCIASLQFFLLIPKKESKQKVDNEWAKFECYAQFETFIFTNLSHNVVV